MLWALSVRFSFQDPRLPGALAVDSDTFRLLAESVEDYAIFILDPQGRVATWNRGAERINGYTEAEIVGRHFSALYPEEDVRAGKCERELLEAERDGRVKDENWRVRKDGTQFWANIVITALRERSGELIGFAKVTRDLSERRRAEHERLLLAQQVAAREAAEHALARLVRLQRLTAAMAAATTPDELASVVVRGGLLALDATAGIFVRAGSADELETVAASGPQAHGLDAFRDFATDAVLIAARVFWSRTSEWIETPGAVTKLYPDVRGGIAALAALPLLLGERSVGSLVYGFAEARDFPEDVRALMETFASQAAQAVERADVHAREIAARQRLEALGRLSDMLAASVTLDDVARAVVACGMPVAGAGLCALFSVDPYRHSLDLVFQEGYERDALLRLRHLSDASAIELCRRSLRKERIWIEDLDRNPAGREELACLELAGTGVRACCALPLSAADEVMGLLVLGSPAPRAFTPEYRDFFETYVRQCSEAMLRARRLEAERAARRLAENLQASLATTLRSIGDAVITTDAEGRVTLMNAAAEQLTGKREREAQGRELGDLFAVLDEKTRRELSNPVRDVLESGEAMPTTSSVMILKAERHEVVFEASAAPVRSRAGSLDGVVLVLRDVTRKRDEEAWQAFLADAVAALAESLDYKQTIARVAGLAVPRIADWCAVHTLEEGEQTPHQLALVSAEADAKTMKRAEDLALRYLSRRRPLRPELHSALAQGLSSEARLEPEERDLVEAIGLRAAIVVPLVARGRALGVLSFAYAGSGRRYGEQDLRFAEDFARRCAIAIENTRLYEAEQRARQNADVASRAKDEFLAVVSHELRTPLNAIMGWAKMLVSAELDPDRQRRAVETIERNAVVMAQLIEDLLDVSRIISGKMRLEVRSVDIVSIVEAAIESVRPSAEARSIRVVSVLDSNVGPLMGDPTRLQQVVWNLLSNAVKFTPRLGRIEVIVRRDESWIDVAVSDTGKGISPSFLPHIFDPFRQQEGGTTRSRGGLGLGLAITQQLVELHGGTIEALSPGEGLGATFVVRLPVAALARISSRPPPGEARQIRTVAEFDRPLQLHGLRVLIVDDEEDARQLVRAVLEECGSIVRAAGSVDEAMNALAEQEFDVMVSDIGMPAHDGYELIRRVRALPAARGGTLPAAALTAYARSEDRRRVLNAGFSMHIPKPVEPAELVSVVASLCRFATRAETPS